MNARPTGVNQLAFALIGAGALWLLLQLGFVPDSLSAALGRWWPLLLVAAGAGLTFPRLGLAPALLLASGAILVFSLVGVAPRVPAATSAMSVPMPATARSAEFEIELASPATAIITSPNTAILFDASFSGSVLGTVTSRGDQQPKVRVAPQRTLTNPFGPSGEWRLTLPATLPLSLDLKAGSGSASVDLSRSLLNDLKVTAASGALDLAFPATSFTADLRGGSGGLRVAVPSGASADLAVRTESGATRLSVGDGADARIELRTRSGSVELTLPPTAPIRLTIERDASGSVSVPAYLTRLSGSGDVGVWESAALQRGGRVIDVRIVSVGSGSIMIN